jgi:hypothetical protein
MAEIRSMRTLFPKVVDYGELIGLIPSNEKFSPSDIDGICERNGQFLIMEWKRPKDHEYAGEKISFGQQRLLQALAKKEGFIVIIVYGHSDDGMKVDRFYRVQPEGPCLHLGNGVEMFKSFYKQWYELADGYKR